MAVPQSRRVMILLFAATILLICLYFYPFLASSLRSVNTNSFEYRGHQIMLPFRWGVASGGPGVVLEKPLAHLSFWDGSTLVVEDKGTLFRRGGAARAAWLHMYGADTLEAEGQRDARTSSFTKAGMICGRVDTSPKSTDIVFDCLSSDSRYTFEFRGDNDQVNDASKIATQFALLTPSSINIH